MPCLTDKQDLGTIISILLVEMELCIEENKVEWQRRSHALLVSAVSLATKQGLVKVDIEILLRALQQVEGMVVMEPVMFKHLEQRLYKTSL